MGNQNGGNDDTVKDERGKDHDPEKRDYDDSSESPFSIPLLSSPPKRLSSTVKVKYPRGDNNINLSSDGSKHEMSSILGESSSMLPPSTQPTTMSTKVLSQNKFVPTSSSQIPTLMTAQDRKRQMMSSFSRSNSSQLQLGASRKRRRSSGLTRKLSGSNLLGLSSSQNSMGNSAYASFAMEANSNITSQSIPSSIKESTSYFKTNRDLTSNDPTPIRKGGIDRRQNGNYSDKKSPSLFGAVMIRTFSPSLNTMSNEKMNQTMPEKQVEHRTASDSILSSVKSPGRSNASFDRFSSPSKTIRNRKITSSMQTPDRNKASNQRQKSWNVKHETPTRTPTIKYAKSPLLGSPSFLLRTPQQHSKSNSNSMLTFNSPGGYAVLKVLDSIHNATPSHHYNSPFHASSPGTKSNYSPMSSTNSVMSGGAQLDDWYEAELGITSDLEKSVRNSNGSSVIMDWTIKHTMKIDCFPGKCLSYLPSSTSTSLFLDHGDSTISSSSTPLPNLKVKGLWQSALCYWQHPATTYDPEFLSLWKRYSMNLENKYIRIHGLDRDGGNIASLTKTTKNSSQSINTDIHKHASDQISLSKQKAVQLALYKMNSTTNTINDNIEKRWRDWQLAFRSMYSTWRKKLESYHQELIIDMESQKMDYSNSNSNSKDSTIRPSFIDAPCFYALQQPKSFTPIPSVSSTQRSSSAQIHHKYHRVILFRCAYNRQDIETQTQTQKIQPVILLSNISTLMAEDLLKLGVTLHNYSKPRIVTDAHNSNINVPTKASSMSDVSIKVNHAPVADEVISNHESNSRSTFSFMGSKKNKDEKNSKPMVSNPVDNNEFKEDLEALRFASTHEENAGGEIYVRRKDRNTASKLLNDIDIDARMMMKDFKNPILIRGETDCHSFFEVFLNLRPDFEKEDVPLLLSRTLGPTLNTSLMSLHVKPLQALDANAPPKDNKDTPKQKNNENKEIKISSLEIKGMILPCAERQLLKAMAVSLLHDKENEDQTREQTAETGTSFNLEKLFQKEQLRSPGNVSVASEDDEVGSHYFVAHLAHLHGGGNLNGLQYEVNEKQDNVPTDHLNLKECKKGESPAMFVWNVTRPNIIMYKTEKIRKVK